MTAILFISLLLSVFAVTPSVVEARPVKIATPVATLNLPGTVMLGENFTFTVTFDNTSGNDAQPTGYGPFIDLFLPLSGIDGALPAPGNDGISLISATYLGTPVDTTTITCTANQVILHPLTNQNLTCPPVPPTYTGTEPYTWQLNVFRLPFGSFVWDQPPVDITVNASLSNLADLGVAQYVYARGGFQFGRDPLDNPVTDPPVYQSLISATTVPTLITLTKTYLGPEDETATGPNYPRRYRIDVDIANGQVLTNFDIIDLLPNNLQYLQFITASPGGYSIIDQPVLGAPQDPPNNDLIVRWASVTGGTGTSDASVTFEFFVPYQNTVPVYIVPPATGDDRTSLNTANAQGTWAPIDPRDVGSLATASGTHTLNDRSIAIQKSVTNLTDATNSPGDVLEYTLYFQISDYFAFQDIILTDTFSDGQRLLLSFTPTMQIDGNQFALPAQAFDPANYDVDLSEIGNDPDPATDGSTTLTFRVSNEMVTRGRPNGWMIGGCVPVNAAGNAGGTGGSDPDCSIYNNGATTGIVRFRTYILEEFSDTYLPNNPSVDQGDSLGNNVTVNGALLDITSLTNPPLGTFEDDDSSAGVAIPRGSLSKSIYAVNGNTSFSMPVQVSPTDTITYRIRYTLPTADVERLFFVDYLPLPVFSSLEVSTFDDVGGAAAPPAGHAKFGPADTFRALSGIVPTITTNAPGNWVEFYYGDFDDPGSSGATVDILFTVTVLDYAFADGLYLTNQVRSNEGSTSGGDDNADAIIQIQLTQAVLNIRKGVVWTDKAGVTYAPAQVAPTGVTFAGTGCPRFTGTIHSNGLAANSIDSNITGGLDAGDRVTFAITVQNTGSGTNGAFDITVTDALPANTTYVPGSLCVTDGTGAAIALQAGGDLFTTGIVLQDPGPTSPDPGALDRYHPTSGRNVALITFDVTLNTPVQPRTTLTNTTTLTNYSNREGGPDLSTVNPTDTATLRVIDPARAKSIIATEINNASNNNLQAVIGEFIDYRVTLTIPEGTTGTVANPARLVDTLDAGLVYVQCLSISANTPNLTSSGGAFDCTNFAPAITNAGRTITYNFGTLTNTDSDADTETLIIEYRVIVDNVVGNQQGNTRRNSAVFSWNGISLTAVRAALVTILEPVLQVTKDALINGGPSGDAGDPVAYTIVLRHPTPAVQYDTDAYDVTFSDPLPLVAVGGPSMILGPITWNVVDSAGLVTNADFQLVGSDATGYTLQTVADFDFPYNLARTITITINGFLSPAANPGQTIVNNATIRWTSLDGAYGNRSAYGTLPTERTGSATPGHNDYWRTDPGEFTVNTPNPIKLLVSTSEGSTAGNRVAVGEIVRYRLTAIIPEGSSPNFQMRDLLGNGLLFLNDGTALAMFVSNNGGVCSLPTIASSTLGVAPWQCGNEGNLATLTPSYVLPDLAVSADPVGNVDVYASGTDVYFKLGDLVNTDSDADVEYVVVEFNALVLNEIANQSGTTLTNQVQVYVNGVTVGGPSPAQDVVVAEPVLTIDKALTTAPQDAGDTVVYTITVRNTASDANRATAFDLLVTDTVSPYLNLQNVAVTAPVGSVVTDTSTLGVGGTVNIAVSQLPPQVDLAGITELTITVTAQVIATAPTGYIVPNTANLTYTSLPGNGTSPNPTGSSVPGGSGTANGERNGNDGVGVGLNNYAAASNVNAPLVSPVIEKLTPVPDQFSIGWISRFYLRVTLPEGVTGNVVVTDLLPDGLSFIGYQVITSAAASGGRLTADFGGVVPAPVVTPVTPGASGEDPVFTFGNISNGADNNPVNDRFLIVVDARVLNLMMNQQGVTLQNSGRLAYTEPGGPHTLTTPPVSISIIEPVLRVNKSAVPPVPADAGGVVTYTVVIDHDPTSAVFAEDTQYTDTLPAELTLNLLSITVTPAGGAGAVTDNSAGNTVSVTVDNMPLGSSVTITYTATLAATVEPLQTIINTGSVVWSTLPGNDPFERRDGDGLLGGGGLNDYEQRSSASITTDNAAIAKVRLGSSLGDTPDGNLTIGETVTYGLQVTLPEGTIPSLQVIDVLPAGLAYVAGSAALDTTGFAGVVPAPTVTTAGGNGDDITFDFGAITVTNDNNPANNTFVIQLTAMALDVPGNVGLPPQTTLVNQATLQVGSQPVLTSNTITETVVEPRLTIGKTFDVEFAANNDIVTITLTVENIGTSTAYDVMIEDPLSNAVFDSFAEGTTPPGFVYSTFSSGGDTVIRYTGGNIPVGATVTFTFSARVINLPSGVTYTNTATVTQYSTLPGVDPNERIEPQVSGSDTLTGIAPDIALQKTSAVTVVAPGDTIIYELVVSNVGTRDATGVTVYEMVPFHTTFNATASLPTVWSCPNGSPAATSCNTVVGNLAVGASVTVYFAVDVVNPIPAGVVQILNAATALDDGTHGVDPNPVNNTDDETDLVNAAPDLTITKDDGGVSTVPGGTVAYTLTYANVGNQGATGVVITDTVPLYTTFNAGASTAGWSCPNGAPAGTVCTINIGAVAAGAGGSVTFAVTVNATVPAGVTEIDNLASVADDGTNGADPTPGNNQDDDQTPLNAAPDLTITKDDGGVSTVPGGTVAYTLTYANVGNQGATGVVITDTVPLYSTFDAGASTAGWSCPNGAPAGTVCTINIGAVAAGAGGSVTFAVTVNDPLAAGVTEIDNLASVADDGTNGADPTPGNNQDDDQTPLNAAPDLTITKDDGGVSTVPGGTVAYTLTYANVGNQGATGVVITDTVPLYSTFNAGASTAGWSCPNGAPAGTVCTINIGAVAAGAGGSVTFAVTVNATVPAGVTEIDNLASVADDGANGADPTPGNNQDDDQTPLNAAPDMTITKDDSGVSTVPGGTVAYTLTYANVGNQGATGVVITDTVPLYTTFDAGASTAGWSCPNGAPAGTVCTINIGAVAAGAGGSVTFAVTVNATVPAGVTEIDNLASVADDGTNGADPTPGNNQDDDQTPLTAAPDLTITKDDGGVSTVPGGTVAYTLTYANVGNQGATGVVITDTVPLYSTFDAGASTAGWSCPNGAPAGTVCTINIGAVAAGAGGSVTFAVTVNDPLAAGVTEIDNLASVADDGTNGADPTPGNNQDDDQTPLNAAPDLTITKDDGGVSTVPGGTVAYTLTYANVGNQGATGVVITDTVPLYTTFDAGVSTPGWSCVPDNNAGSVCTINIGSVAAGAGGSVTFAVTVNDPLAAGVTEIDNLASVADDGTNGADPTSEDNQDDDQTPVDAAPDLSIDKSDGVTQVAPGATLTYTLTIRNTGNQDASGVQVVDLIPLNTAFVSASHGGWYDSGTRQVFYPPFLLPAGEMITRVVTVRVDNPLPPLVTEITNYATVTDDDGNTDDAEDTDIISGASKSLVADSLADTVTPEVAIGEILTYEVTLVINPGTVTDLTLTDVMARGLAFVDCISITDGSGGQLSPTTPFASVCASPAVVTEPAGSTNSADAGRRVTFSFGDVTNIGEVDAALTVRYRAVVLNTSGNVRDVTLGNDATWTWTGNTLPVGSQPVVIVEPDMTLVKTIDKNVALPGEVVTFTLTVNHDAASNQDGYDVLLTDQVPFGLIYVPGSLVWVSGVAPDLIDQSGAPLLRVGWNVYPQNAGPTVLQFSARVANLKPGTVITNTASLSWTSLPGDYSLPQSSYNDNSTERFYDPGSTVNIYGVNSSITLTIPELPETGFAPGVVTEIGVQPASMRYADLGSVWVEIPRLGVALPIVGVPFKDGAWDLTWLGTQAGWLEGTAFPSWTGNSGLTAHVYNADGTPGPFYNLNTIKWGDIIIVHAYGVKYIYHVRQVLNVTAKDLSPLKHEKLSWLTLITCRDYDPVKLTFRSRVAVRAVLIKYENE